MRDAFEHNQRALVRELARIANYLRAPEVAENHAPELDPPADYPPALRVLVEAFGLSPFERDVLLLCAGCELEAELAELCRQASGDTRASFGLALGALPEAHWSALAPAAPLRRWHLIEIEPAESLSTSHLRIDERILHHLAGLSYLDGRLAAVVRPIAPPDTLPDSQMPAADRVADVLTASAPAPAVVIHGADARVRADLAAYGISRAGLRPHMMAAADLAAHPEDRSRFARLWEREALLAAGALVVELDVDAEPELARRVDALAQELGVGLIIAAPESIRLTLQPTVCRIEATRPTSVEQQQIWQRALGGRVHDVDGALSRIVEQFDLQTHQIVAAAAQVSAAGGQRELWDACRGQARPALEQLAHWIDPLARWKDLVLPAAQVEVLREVVAHVRRRARVYEQWGFAGKSARGLGISALFEGPSGTGKTMAAEVLANELELDLYRIDLSQVVSKYIGETEKNLRRVFDAAESGAGILLFDEADALFGKRSEVRDSHDRYANVEISYLLQRMEEYRGLAILTTNVKEAIDQAFLRRIRFVVRFPFPDPAGRAEIWRGVFPDQTPTEDLALETLASLSVTGASIRNIALGAAFLAADEQDRVRMSHLRRAAQRECLKLGRPLTNLEAATWA